MRIVQYKIVAASGDQHTRDSSLRTAGIYRYNVKLSSIKKYALGLRET